VAEIIVDHWIHCGISSRRRHGLKRRGLSKPETFTFLGFTFICGKSRRGKFPEIGGAIRRFPFAFGEDRRNNAWIRAIAR
jgi:hypothetical protein